MEWLRALYCYPERVDERLLDTMKRLPNVCDYLDLPMQHISQHILTDMNRTDTSAHIREVCRMFKERGMMLRTTLMVGFPGETDEDFEQTLKLVQDTRFDLLFTFLYSPRTGTPAASYEDNATPQDKQRRFERLLKAQDEIVAEKQAAYKGRKLRLLVDGNAKGSEYPFTARTEGNLLVCVRGDDIKIGEFIEAEIEKTSLRCLFAHKL